MLLHLLLQTEDKYRLMKTGRLTVVGEAFVMASKLCITREESLCRTGTLWC